MRAAPTKSYNRMSNRMPKPTTTPTPRATSSSPKASPKPPLEMHTPESTDNKEDSNPWPEEYWGSVISQHQTEILNK